MSYIHYAQGLAGVYSMFLDRLAEDLESNGIEVLFEREKARSPMIVRYGEEGGEIAVRLSGPDLEVSFRDRSSIPGEVTFLALLVAETVTDIDDEMRAVLDAGDEEGEGLPTGVDIGVEIEDTFRELQAVRDEIDLLRIKGEDVGRPERRVDRAEKLYREASTALKKGEPLVARAKAQAMQVMVEKAEASLGEIGGEKI
ncbi:hypothetical protein [uncultured Methanofollis sp.]|uniref:hypothetical protein n=1 Tax=uncultured Methanofollis sp. TaxID=262500 RepID=UPI0026247985|nr:hypothetical protein [uncultured Methanofollis sp.]